MTPEQEARLQSLLYRTQNLAELAEVFTLLAVDCKRAQERSAEYADREYWRGRAEVWDSAAQMIRQRQEDKKQEKQGDGTA